MDLLLAEQLLLLALDDVRGRDSTPWAGEAGLAAALLLDLGRRDLLQMADDDELVVLTDAEAPEHPLLRDVHLAILSSPKCRSAQKWVERLPRDLKPLRVRLAEVLVERGVLSEQRSHLLGILPRTRFPTADPVPEDDVRRRLVEVLVGGRTPTQDEALLIGLVEPVGLVDRVVPRRSRSDARRRAKTIGEQGVAGTALPDAVRQLQAACYSAAVVSVIAAGVSSW